MSNLLNAYLSMTELATQPSSGLSVNSRVMVVPPGDGAPLTNAYVALGDFKTYLLTEIQAQVDQLETGGGTGYWPAPITFALTGTVTGSVQVDGSGNVSLATAIASNALSVGMVNGLSATLLDLQDQIDHAGGFDPSHDIALNKNAAASPLLSWTASDGSGWEAGYDSGTGRLQFTALGTGGQLSSSVVQFADGQNGSAGLVYLGGTDLQVYGSQTSLFFDTVGGYLELYDTNGTAKTFFDTQGRISTNGTTYNTLWHAGNLNPASLPKTWQTFGTAAFLDDFSLPPYASVSYWNPSSTSTPSGIDDYGTLLAFSTSNTGSLVPADGLYINHLLFGTNGKLMWRQNVNGGSWTQNQIWHSGNFQPGSFVSQNSTLNATQISLVKDSTGGNDGGTNLIGYRSDGGIGITTSKGSDFALFNFTPLGLVSNAPFNALTYNATATGKTGTLAQFYNTSPTNDPQGLTALVGLRGSIYVSDTGFELHNSAGQTVFVVPMTNSSYAFTVPGSIRVDQGITTTAGINIGGSVIAQQGLISNTSLIASSYGTFRGLRLSASRSTGSTTFSYNDNSDGKSVYTNAYNTGAGGFTFEIYGTSAPTTKVATPLDLGPSSSTAAGAWTFSNSLTVAGSTVTVNSSDEGHLLMGNTDVYLFGNNTSIGAYGSTFGNAYNYTFSTKVFNINGTQTTTSDERLKEGFMPLIAEPLWRMVPLETWNWIKDGIVGVGPRAQAVLAAASRYVHEDKEMPIAEMLGKPPYEVKKALQRIAAGKEVGTLTVDKTGMALETAYAAGQLVDALAEEVAALRKQVEALTGSKKK